MRNTPDSTPATVGRRPAPAQPAATLACAPLDTVDTQLCSQTLLQGRKTVEIRHNGAIYRLQSTRQGKLILTK